MDLRPITHSHLSISGLMTDPLLSQSVKTNSMATTLSLADLKHPKGTPAHQSNSTRTLKPWPVTWFSPGAHEVASMPGCHAWNAIAWRTQLWSFPARYVYLNGKTMDFKVVMVTLRRIGTGFPRRRGSWFQSVPFRWRVRLYHRICSDHPL